MKLFTAIAVAAVAVLGVQGCNVGPDYHAPMAKVPTQFSAVAPATRPVAPIDMTLWWKSMDDPELNDLIDRAIAANPDLQMALMRVQQSRAIEAAVAGGGFPAVDLSGGAGRGSGTNSVKGRIPGPLNAGTNTTGLKEITEVAGFDAAWELDLFGSLRRQLEAAHYDTQAAIEARRDVLITLISDVARAYVDSRAMQLRLQVLTSEISAERQTLNLVQAQNTWGFTNELNPTEVRRELGAMVSEIAPLQAASQQDRRRLATLLGEFPPELAAQLSSNSQLPQLPAGIEPGLPLDLLRRRPDIREAERELAASTARIGVATAALYPQVVLTGGLGMQGQGLGRTPVVNSFIGSIGPAAYWPILDFGTLDALVERQDYRTRELLLNYRATVLDAVEEVDNAIDNFTAQQQRLRDLEDALSAARRAVDIATQLYQRGFTSFLDVLDAQRSLYDLQNQEIAAREEVIVQFIAVYKALGGGWEKYDAIPAIRHPLPTIMAIFHPTSQPDDTSK